MCGCCGLNRFCLFWFLIDQTVSIVLQRTDSRLSEVIRAGAFFPRISFQNMVQNNANTRLRASGLGCLRKFTIRDYSQRGRGRASWWETETIAVIVFRWRISKENHWLSPRDHLSPPTQLGDGPLNASKPTSSKKEIPVVDLVNKEKI